MNRFRRSSPLADVERVLVVVGVVVVGDVEVVHVVVVVTETGQDVTERVLDYSTHLLLLLFRLLKEA